MIIDTYDNIALYSQFGKGVTKALEFLQKTDFTNTSPGKYEIDGSKIFYLITSYETKLSKDCKFEAHHQYIDIHSTIEGEEKIAYSNLKNLKVVKEYDKDSDVSLFSGNGDLLTVKKGRFAMFFPSDAHMPSLQIGKPKLVKKIVIKVKI